LSYSFTRYFLPDRIEISGNAAPKSLHTKIYAEKLAQKCVSHSLKWFKCLL